MAARSPWAEGTAAALLQPTWKAWIPAFAGKTTVVARMTEKRLRVCRLCAEYGP